MAMSPTELDEAFDRLGEEVSEEIHLAAMGVLLYQSLGKLR